MGGMSGEQTSRQRRVPYIWLAVMLLLLAYVAAYYALSTVRVVQDSSGRIEARHFGSRAALAFFRPMTFVESRFVRERRFGYRD